MPNKRTIKQKLGGFLISNLPVSRESFEKLRFEWNALSITVNNRINPVAIARINRYRSKTGLSVNIGSGPFGKESWTNIDMFRHENVSFLYDCRKRLPFKDGTVDRIRCEHVFEHLGKENEVPKFLKDCLRCLRQGGVMRIIVPDLELFINAYYTGTKEAWGQLGYNLSDLPGGLETPMDILNYTFRQNGEHKYAYDFKTLHATLRKAGFTTIERAAWGRSIDPLLEDDLEVHKFYSLYVDCIK